MNIEEKIKEWKEGAVLGNKVWCEIHGDEDYYIEPLHKDLNGKLFQDIIAKCGSIICTLSSNEKEESEGK